MLLNLHKYLPPSGGPSEGRQAMTLRPRTSESPSPPRPENPFLRPILKSIILTHKKLHLRITNLKGLKDTI